MPKHINVRRRIVGVKNGLVALLFLAAYSLSAALPFMPTGRAAAYQPPQPPQKVFVCKYVGTPGDDERLQTGQNPISVSVNAIPNYQGVGSYFADQHGRSYVLALDTGQPEPSVSQCPAPQGPTKLPVPATPSVTDPCGPNNATWNKPADTTSLDWSLSNGKLSVTTKTGYIFDDGTTYHYYGYAQDSGVPCLTPVQPTAPTVKNDACGTQTDTYTIPSKTGVQYYVGGNPVSAGTYPTNGALQVNITAQATQGYVLTGQSSWTLNFTNVPCIIPVEPVAPTKSDSCGTKNDTFTIPDVQGVQYYVKDGYQYKPIAPGTYPANDDKVEIKAEAKTGYKLVGANDYWKLYFSNEPCKVTAVAPTKSDPCGTKNDTFTIPYVEGVKYYVKDGYHYKPIAPGTYPAGGWKVEIKAEAKDGYKLVGDDDWTLWFDTKPCLVVVTPQPPVHVPVCGPNNDEVDLPEIQGVIYKTYWKGNMIIVKAMPAPGYVFPDDSETEESYTFGPQSYQNHYDEHDDWEWVWKFTDENTLCPASVTVPVDPTVVCGPNNDIVVLPTAEHVTYTQTGWVNGQNTVTATADDGYYIAGTEGETSVSWTYTDSNTSCGHVLGDTTPTPTPTVPQVLATTTELEDTGANTSLVMYMSLGALGLAVLTFMQSSKRKVAFVPVRVQRGLDRVRGVLAQPFMLP